MTHRIIETNEAEWGGAERYWASIQQFPPRKGRSSWWLVAIGAVVVLIALGMGI